MTEQRVENVQRGQEFDPTDEPRLRGLVEFLSSGSGPTPDPGELVTLAMAAVTSSRHACLAVSDDKERVRTLASTSDDAEVLDRLQQAAGDGPALDVVESIDVLRVPDITVTNPWPRFAEEAIARGIRSMLVVRIPVDAVGIASLTFYAERADAFDDQHVGIAAVCGSFMGLILRSARDRERAENLEIALATSRHIGTAIGILMARELLTADQAFERLRATSQRTHRKLRDVADDVVNTGQLPGADAS